MITYKQAGVDIDAGEDLIDRIKKIVPDIGGFGGLYPMGDQYLVAGADGVGTKLKVAFDLDKHDTIGIDLVAMSVNDVITTGARPLFFLDYFATSKLDVDKAEQVIRGVAEGCRMAGCVLLGGETAEMPGFYRPGEYDLSGFCVGVVDKKRLIDGKTIQPGDKIVGIESSGLHSNGYSLVRKVFKGQEFPPEFLTPTRIYTRDVESVDAKIKGIAHITGGGFLENIPRILPEGVSAEVEIGSWPIHPLFVKLQEIGLIEDEEMFRTFNMGIGMVLVLDHHDASKIVNERHDFHMLGTIVEGEKRVVWR